MAYEVDNLEIVIKSKSDEAVSSVDKLIKKMSELKNTTVNTFTSINSQSSSSGINTLIQKTSILNSSIKNSNNQVKNFGNNSTKAFTMTVAKITATYLVLRKVWNILSSSAQKSIAYTENLNLFTVTMGKSSEKAFKFQYKLHEAYSTNISDMLRYQGVFNQLAVGLGMTNEASNTLSENMIKLGIDLSSLFNISEENAMEKLQAGLVGQTKPLRTLGIDVTFATLKPLADSLGIKEQLKNLSQAEKMILRYIAILNQAKNAQGDFARTIESPANQIKILKQQISELGMSVANTFMGLFGAILPYINGFIMALKEVFVWLSSIFGYDVSSYISDTNKIGSSTDDLGTSLGNASDKAKKLKYNLQGFDEIHNIDTSVDTGTAGGGFVGGGVSSAINDKLISAMKDYDNLMSSVKSKATGIRDRILEWLGYTKQINPITGEVTWKLKDGNTNLSKILTLLKGIGIAIAGIGIIKLIGGVGNLITAFNGGKIASTGFLAGISFLGKGFAGAKNWIVSFIAAIKGTIAGNTAAKSALTFLTSGIAKFIGVTGGSITAIDGAIRMTKSWNNVLIDSKHHMKNVSIGMAELVGGAALAGGALGGVGGAVIGALLGSLVSLGITIKGYKQELKELSDRQIFGDISISSEEWIKMFSNMSGSTTYLSDKMENLKSTISSLSETFSAGYGYVEEYTYKVGALKSKITTDDYEDFKQALSNMMESSSQIIDKNTTYMYQVWESSFSNMTSFSKDEQKKILSNVVDYGKKQKEGLKTAQDNITKTYDKAIKARRYLTDDERKYIQNQLNKIKELTEVNITASNATLLFLQEKYSSDKKKLDEKSYSEYKKAYETYDTEQKKKIADSYAAELNSYRSQLSNKIISQSEYNKAVKDANTRREMAEQEHINIMSGFGDTMSSNIFNQYIALENNTDRVSKQARKKLEEMFKDLAPELDFKKTLENFKTIGKTSGETYKKAAESNMKITPKIGSPTEAMKKAGKNAGSSWATGFKSKLSQNLSGKMTSSIESLFGVRLFENGGFPTTGQLFVAREAGAELVGNVGNKTAVVNNEQIVQSVSQGVYSAVSQAMANSGNTSQSQTITGTINGRNLIDIVINGVNGRTQQNGKFVFDLVK